MVFGSGDRVVRRDEASWAAALENVVNGFSKRGWTRAIIDRLIELVIVFVGVYAAFVLNSHQNHEQERQRRQQILAYLEKQATASAEKLQQVTASYDHQMNAFLGRVVTMPMKPIGFCRPAAWNYSISQRLRG